MILIKMLKESLVMIKPLNMIFIIPKNEAHFCVQCECFVNLNICPICYSDTLDMSSILDKNFTRPAPATDTAQVLSIVLR